MHCRIGQLGTAIVMSLLAGGCGDPQLAPDDQSTSFAQGGADPSPPSNLQVGTVTVGRIDLGWQDNSTSESGFEVQRAVGQGGSFSLIATTAAKVKSYSDTKGLAGGTTYCYRVRAFKTTGGKTTFSTFAGPACATTLSPPAAAFAVTARPVNSRLIRIGWQESAPDEDGFRVERAPGQAGPWVTAVAAGANQVSAFDAATTDLPVCYRVVAFNHNGDSPPSNTSCTAAPAAPTNLRAVATDEHTVNLSWDPHPASPPAVNDGYRVLRHDAFRFSLFVQVALLPASATSYHDVLSESSEFEVYVVQAMRDGGYSDSSNTVQVLLQAPSAPTDLVAYPLGSTATLVYWTDNSAAEDGFRLERGPADTGPWETIAQYGSDHNSDFDYTVVAEQRVCYRAIAFNGKGASQPSDPDCTAAPAAPANLRAVADYQSIDLIWDARPSEIDGYTVRDGYRIYRADPSSGVYELVTDLPADATGFHDGGLESQSYYAYLVFALNDSDPYGLFGDPNARGTSDGVQVEATTAAAPGTIPSLTAVAPHRNTAAAGGQALRALTRALQSRKPGRTRVTPAATPALLNRK
jgi:hypothetical protein